MKTLSIKQPWASLIAQGIKDIENRTWQTHFRGKILIHASSPQKFHIQLTDMQAIKAMPIVNQAIDGMLPFGAIIGEVEIIDCVKDHRSIWAEQDVWNWVLANPVLYNEPILNIKGKLSLWEFELPSINANALCLDCGTTKENAQTGYCIHGHDNWLERHDEMAYFRMAEQNFGVDLSTLIRSIENNIDLKPLNKN